MNVPGPDRHDTETVVIGGGIIGLAITSCLQERGRPVLLLDRKGIALEASYGNAGAFAFSDVMPLASPGIMRKAPRWLLDPLGPLAIPPRHLPRIAPWLFRFWRASRPDRVRHSILAQVAMMRLAEQEMSALVARHGLASMVHADGALELYESEEEWRASLSGWDLRAAHGIAFRHLRGGEIAALQPGLSPRIRVATFVPGWKTVTDPHLFAQALAARLQEQGLIFRQAEVRAVRPDEDGCVSVYLADGTELTASRAVIACGAWSRPLALALGDRIPLETERGYNTTLPPGAFDLRRQLTFGAHGFVVTPIGGGVRVGGAVELGGLLAPPNYARSQALLDKAATFLPQLRTTGGTQWMGFRPSLPDSLPVIGPSRASPRILYAFGHGHLGLTQSAATGRLIADLITGEEPPLDPAPFRAGRF
ncbi:amino acid dehydrogenase [Roseomonas gilardii]|uniref:Amino acid dehydrogenase n=1 Tax=Roseomonas gilardii TaxID=257708 RepID=A0A1L7ALZ8_9PROT|nr:FAD-dependent oxidoreductase [Roseomonas gilardii]APT59828.1 amino acid dehydrogenase [Roseomonas gilardii]